MSGQGKMVSGGIEYLKGKLQRAVGKLTGNRGMQAKGYMNQGKGGAKYGVGKTEKRVDDLTK